MKWEDFVRTNSSNPYFKLIGNGISMKYTYGNAEYFVDKGWPHIERDGDDLVLTGLIVNHRKENGETCGGAVTFAKPKNPTGPEVDEEKWEVLCLEPLSITPSVKCQCGKVHGHITNGQWQPTADSIL